MVTGPSTILTDESYEEVCIPRSPVYCVYKVINRPLPPMFRSERGGPLPPHRAEKSGVAVDGHRAETVTVSELVFRIVILIYLTSGICSSRKSKLQRQLS
jgi:hypothetical protein